MPHYYHLATASNITFGSSGWVNLAQGDSFLLGLEINQTNLVGTPAIYGAGGNTIRIAGTANSAGSGIEAGSNLALHVTSSGVINSVGQALWVNGNAATIVNEGVIASSSEAGIFLEGAQTNRIINSGTIMARAEAINYSPFASEGNSLSVHNTGTILSQVIVIRGDGGADRIVNEGLIERSNLLLSPGAALSLGGGDDYYDGRLGEVIGQVRLGSGNDTAYGGDGGETFDGSIGDDVIDGGGGADTIVFTGGPITVDLRLADRQDTGEGFDIIRNVENVVAGGGSDLLIGNDAANLLLGGNGNDLLEGGFGEDTLNGGGNFDVARYSGSTGAAVDLSIAGRQNTGYGLDTLIDIEALEGGAGADRFTGSDAADRLAGHGGDDVLMGGKGDDTLDGGSGQNTAVFTGPRNQYAIAFNADGTITVADTKADRDGADTLMNVRFAKFADSTIALTNVAPAAIALSNGFVTENTPAATVVAYLSAQDAGGDALTYSLVSDPSGIFGVSGNSIILAKAPDYESASQHTIAVGVRDTQGAEIIQSFTFQVGDVVETTPQILYGTAGADSQVGEAGNDLIYGFSGNDALWGEAGDDKLSGGAGRDVLTGGAGRDIFVFDVTPNKRKAHLDRITDFNVKDDTIHLKKSAFAKIAKKKALAKYAFCIGKKAQDAEDRIIYNKKTGALSYDADGSGKGAAIHFATLAKNLKLGASDFEVI